MERKEKMKKKKSVPRLFLVMISACLLLTVGMTACSSDESDENDVYYTAEVLAIEPSQLFGRAKIIHSAKDHELSERLSKNAQFIFRFKNKTTYDIAENDIITFKVIRKIIPDPDGVDTGLFDRVEIEIIKIKRK